MITNKSDISLALAVWLLADEYDYVKDKPNYVSATTLLKPLRQIIQGPRTAKVAGEQDVEDFINRAMGNALHDSIERAWKTNPVRALRLLGIPESAIERVRVNPTDEEVRASNSIIPIYLENRAYREVAGFTLGGKFDMVTDGIVQDTKSTSAYSWTAGTKDDDYRLQMSIYRWIDAAQTLPKIKEDYGTINFIFTDWQRYQARSNPAYPQKRVEKKDIRLLSLRETEQWVTNKLALIQRHLHTPEALLPECTDEELWRSDPKFKYYADPLKVSGKSSKNFDSLADANAYRAEKGKGIVITKPGEPKRCNYCEAFNSCTQKDKYFS